jgi:hypothetical protein
MMADTPISDSYIETVEAGETYFSGDPRATAFLAIDDPSWYYQRATKHIDALPLAGERYETDRDLQPLAFPRWLDGIPIAEDPDTGEAEVPQEVLDACCEEALALYLHYANTDAQERRSLQDQGVKAYSLGSAYSETLGSSITTRQNGLISSDAYRLMKEFLAGSVETRF